MKTDFTRLLAAGGRVLPQGRGLCQVTFPAPWRPERRVRPAAEQHTSRSIRRHPAASRRS